MNKIKEKWNEWTEERKIKHLSVSNISLESFNKYQEEKLRKEAYDLAYEKSEHKLKEIMLYYQQNYYGEYEGDTINTALSFALSEEIDSIVEQYVKGQDINDLIMPIYDFADLLNKEETINHPLDTKIRMYMETSETMN